MREQTGVIARDFPKRMKEKLNKGGLRCNEVACHIVPD
jgi:hypothetical protein